MTEEKQEAQAAAEETPEKKEPSLTEIQSLLEEEKKARLDLEKRSKDLSSKLTKTQQENAEFVRLFKSTMPKLNKKFDEQWEENPEEAVASKVQTTMVPLNQQLQVLSGKQAFNDLMRRHPTWSKYEDRVIELGDEYPEDTYSEKGLVKLFKYAMAEDLEKNGMKKEEEPEDKKRAFSESPSAKSTVQPKKRISAEEKLVAEKLGVDVEQYLAMKERGYGSRA